MLRATHKHKMPAQHAKEMVGIIIFFGVLGGVLRITPIGFTNTNMLFVFGLGFLLSGFMFTMGLIRRNGTKLIAEMDETKGTLRVWMHRPVPMWRGKLSKEHNALEVKNISNAYVSEINKNQCLVLRNEANNALINVPARIARQPEVVSFFTKSFETADGKKVPSEAKKVILDFITGKD